MLSSELETSCAQPFLEIRVTDSYSFTLLSFHVLQRIFFLPELTIGSSLFVSFVGDKKRETSTEAEYFSVIVTIVAAFYNHMS